MIPYTQRLSFDVLTAPLPAIDRRALSQAWYSALHLAQDDAPAQPGRRAAAVADRARAVASSGRPSGRDARGAESTRSRELARPPAPVAGERRTARSAFSRRIERAALRALPAEGAALCVVRGESGRIALLVRTRGGNVELIAICAPGARAAVARAMEEARYALARRGLACAAHVREADR